MKNNSEKWKFVGKDDTYKKRRLKRQLSVFLACIILIIVILILNIVCIKKFNTNILTYGYNYVSEILNKDVQEDIAIENIVTQVENEIERSANTEIKNESEEIKSNVIEYKNIFTVTNNNIINLTANPEKYAENSYSSVYLMHEDIPLNLKILEIDDSKEVESTIYVYLDGYTTDPSIYYSIDIETDEEYLLDNEPVGGGYPFKITTRKIDFLKDERLKITAYEKENDSEDIISSGKIIIDLNKDLIQKEDKINSKKRIETNWKDLSMSILEGGKTYNATYGNVSSDEFYTDYYDYQLEKQYGDECFSEGVIQISCIPNENNLSLDEFVKAQEVILNVSQYAVMKNYVVYLAKNDEMDEEIQITFDQMLDFANGKDIIVNNKEYNLKDYDNSIGDWSFENIKHIKKFGVDVVELDMVSSENAVCHKYFFMVKNEVYEISYTTEVNELPELEKFLNELKVR